MIQGFLCYEVGDPFQAASDFSAPIVLAALCCLQQAYLQSIRGQIVRNSVSLSSSLCKGVERVAQYQFMRSHPMQNVNTSNNKCIESSLFVTTHHIPITTHHIQCHELHRFMLITLHKIVTPFNLTWMIWEEMSGLVAKNAYIFVQKLNGT